MKVYVAGPAFTPHGREYLLQTIQQLRERGFEATGAPENLLTGTSEALYDQEQVALREADAILAILDGTQVDDGVACRMGLFYGLMRSDSSKRGIVGLLSDERALRRSAHGYGINLFVLGTLEDRGAIYIHIEDALRQLEIWREETSPIIKTHSGFTTETEKTELA